MAGTVNAGSIVYDVDMDTAGLLAGRREIDAALNGLNGSMGRVEASVNRTERAVASIGRTMSSLTSVAKGLMAALSVKQVTDYANAWVDVSNKLANSRRANEDLLSVTSRVFDISQDTRASLEATATLYGRLERATRSAGTSTADLASLTTTINKAFVVSGASAEEAAGAITQLSQGLASGVLRGEEFNSVSENGSRLAVALADSLGVTIGQLRGMAAQGKLTTEVVVNGLLKQGDAIAKEFANTTLTMGQAFTVAANNITKFVGEASSVNTTLNVFNRGVITLSENLSTVANVIGAFAVIMGGRFVGALVAATSARVSDALAARAQAVATSDAAAATQVAATVTARKAMLDKEAALSSLALAQAEYNVAKGSAAEAFALENLNAVKSIAIQRSAAFTEAQIAQAAATRTASAAAAAATTTVGGLARGALALIGGPAGAAVIAGAAIFYFFQKAQQAKQESIDFADKLDGLIGKMKEMSQIQLAAEIDKANKSIAVQNGELSNNESTLAGLNARLEEAKKAVAGMSQGDLLYASAVDNLNTLQSEQIQLTAQVERERNKLSQTISKTGILQAQANGTFAQGIDLLKRDGHEAGVASGLFNQLGNALNLAASAKDKFNSQSLKVERPKNVQDYLDKLSDQVEIQGELNERKRAQLQAEKDIRALGGSEADVLLARQRAGAEFDAVKSQQALKKETKDATAEGKKAANQAESIAQKLANLKQQSEMAAGSTQELSRTQAMLRAEQSLGKGATQAQIDLARKYAAAAWDVGAALKAQSLIPEIQENKTYSDKKSQLEALKTAKDAQGNLLISQQQYNHQSAQLEQEHATQLAQIRANQVVTPQQEAAGTVDPVQQLENENAKKLALIQQYEANKTITEQQGIALRNAANTQYEQQRIAAQWQMFAAQSQTNQLIADTVDALGGSVTSSITGLISGTTDLQSAISSISNTILNELVGSFVKMGVEWVKSAIMGQTAQVAATAATTSAAVAGTATTTAASVSAATATTVAWTPAAIVASIGSFGGAAAIGIGAVIAAMALSSSIAGKRKNGGPVSAGSMYQVGEGGMPEIYQSSSGRQYMIPGDNGSVISNKDMQSGSGVSGSGINVNVNITNTNGSYIDQQVTSDGAGGVTVDVIVADLDNGGPISNALTRNTSATRRATA